MKAPQPDSERIHALEPASLFSLAGRVAVVTGAAGGIGRWLAAGCQVRIWPPDREGQDLADHAEAIRAEIQQGTKA